MDEKNNQEAIDGFEDVVTIEQGHIENKKLEEAKWSFKSLSNLVTLYAKEKNTDKCTETYKRLLNYKGDDVNENELNKSISSILDSLEDVGDDRQLVEMYNITEEILTKGKY